MTEPSTAARSTLPLFYRTPQPLSSAVHEAWRLTAGDVAFASDTPFVPIVIGELAEAARCYPVVFAGGDAQPLALLGLEKRNLFVDEGQWTADHYVPAYVRRYPFGFVPTANPEGFALAIDAASARVLQTGTEGAALFEQGEPTAVTREALAFCDAFQSSAAATRAFVEALRAEGLLIDRRADATLADGRKLGLDGLQIIDADKVTGLADAVVVDWHRKGWLALIAFHIKSLDRFAALLDLQAASVTEVAPPMEASQPDRPAVVEEVFA